jgi:hypothetical protein
VDQETCTHLSIWKLSATRASDPLIHRRDGGRKEGLIRTMRKNTESITSKVMIRACLDRPIAMASLETVVQRRICDKRAVGRGSQRNAE